MKKTCLVCYKEIEGKPRKILGAFFVHRKSCFKKFNEIRSQTSKQLIDGINRDIRKAFLAVSKRLHERLKRDN